MRNRRRLRKEGMGEGEEKGGKEDGENVKGGLQADALFSPLAALREESTVIRLVHFTVRKAAETPEGQMIC